MKQVMIGGTGNINDSSFGSWQGYKGGDGDEQLQQSYIPEAGVMSYFRHAVTVAPGAGKTRTAQLNLDTVATALSCSFSGTDLFAEDADTVSIPANSLVATQCFRTTGSAAPGNWTWASVFEPTVANTFVWGSFKQVGVNNATRFAGIGGHGSIETTDALARLPWGTAGQIKTIRVRTHAAPGVGKQWQYQIYLNGVAQAASIFTQADAATTANISGLSIAVVPTDLLSLEIIPTGIPTAPHFWYGISFAPTTDGQWNVSGWQQGEIDDAEHTAVIFDIQENIAGLSPWIGTQAHSASGMGWQLSNFYVLLDTAPGGITSRTVTMEDTGASTALTVTVSGASTSASVVANVPLAGPIVLRWNKSGVPAGSSRYKWTFCAEFPVVTAASGAYAFIT